LKQTALSSSVSAIKWARSGSPGSRIEGAIVVEYEVELFISDEAEVTEVRGAMTLDDAQRFSGDTP
jgi:hypothetical protein